MSDAHSSGVFDAESKCPPFFSEIVSGVQWYKIQLYPSDKYLCYLFSKSRGKFLLIIMLVMSFQTKELYSWIFLQLGRQVSV